MVEIFLNISPSSNCKILLEGPCWLCTDPSPYHSEIRAEGPYCLILNIFSNWSISLLCLGHSPAIISKWFFGMYKLGDASASKLPILGSSRLFQKWLFMLIASIVTFLFLTSSVWLLTSDVHCYPNTICYIRSISKSFFFICTEFRTWLNRDCVQLFRVEYVKGN